MIEETLGYDDGGDFATEILQTFNDQDIDLDQEYIFALYLYLPSMDAAKTCQEKIHAQGFFCEVEEPLEDDNDWLCYVEVENLIPSISTLEPIGSFLIGLAEEYKGEFDGWEIKNNIEMNLSGIVNYDDLAQSVLETVKSNFAPFHEYIQADLNDFSDLDVSFYNKVQNQFNDLGYVFISDIEDKNISSQGVRTVIRTLYHPELHHIAAFYYVPIMGAGIFEIESFLSDNQMILSTIAPESFEITDWPCVESAHYDIDINIHDLHKHHLDTVASYKLDNQECKVLKVDAFDTLVEKLNELNQHKFNRLEEIGWVTKEYLLAQTGGDETIATGVYNAIQSFINQ